MKRQIVSHLIAGYPSIEESFTISKALIDGGVYALEIQIPFSDPCADGPVIEGACQNAIQKGFKVKDGFRLIERIKEYNSRIPIYIMSYGSIVFTYGIENFVAKSKEVGAKGLIIPDLTLGQDEGLYIMGKKYDIDIVPVLVTSVNNSRLDEIMSIEPEWVYVALRSGITGSYTNISKDNINFLSSLKKYNVKIMAGFGIQSREQIDILDEHVDASVMGSHLVKVTNKAKDQKLDLYDSVKSVIKELI